MSIYRYPARCREKGCKLIGTLRDAEKSSVNLCREKGCKFIGTLQDVEKKGCTFIGTLRDA